VVNTLFAANRRPGLNFLIIKFLAMSSNTSALPLPAIFVGKETINRRVKRYLQSKHPQLSRTLGGQGTGREDTKSIWYSREHVETWLEEMNGTKADGMRVYFGAYDDNEGPANGQLCLLMVLTRAGADGAHKDIILEEEADFEARRLAPKERSAPGDLFDTEGRSREYNYGSPCPPICDGGGSAFPQ
jgi:hypothetical protein